MDYPVNDGDLSLVRFDDAEVIGSPKCRCNDVVNVLATIVNGSNKVLGAVGDRPIHLAGRVFDLDGREIGGQEPRRSMLAKVIPPGGRAPGAIEVQLPKQPGEITIVPTMVQEGVVWRPSVLAEGITVTTI
jgi:hypothetical protein